MFGKSKDLKTFQELRFPVSKLSAEEHLGWYMEEIHKENIISEDNIICVVARAGSNKPITVAGTIKDLSKQDFGSPLHTLVIPGKLHFMEIEALKSLAQLPAQQGRKIQKL